MHKPLEEVAEASQRQMRPGDQSSEDAISNADASADSSPQRHERVLIVTPTAGLDQLPYRVLAEAGLSCEVIADINDLIGRVQQVPGCLLVEQAALTPRVTEALTALLQNQLTWSDLPVIVLAAPGANRPPESLHAYASLIVLEQPLRQQELVSMVRAVLTLRRRQDDLGDQLAQRESAQQALRQQDHTVHEILEAVTDFFFAVDRQWRFTYVNSHAADYFGQPVQELIGQVIWEAVPQFAGTIFESRARGAMYDQLSVHLTGVGPINGRWCETSIYPSADGLSIYGRDVHDSQLAKQALVQQTRNLQELAALLDLANGMVLDLNQRIVHWSRGAQRLYGFTAQEATGRISHDLLQTRFGEPLEQIRAKLFQSGCWEGELAQTRKDGSTLEVASLWVLRRSAQGAPTAILEVNNDITARRQVEQAYRRLFDNKINGMAHGRVIEDESGQPVDFVFLEVNDTFERMTGLRREMVTGRRFTEVIPNLHELCLNPVAACWQVARTGEEAQFEFRHEQTNRWFSVYLYSPRPGEFIGIFTDISQRKQAEQRLQELNETLERRVQERTAEAEYRATQLRRLAAELTQAEERERRRLARVLHDHLQQLLVGMRLSLTSLQRQLPTEELRQSAQQMDDLLNQSIATSRSLTAELSPPVLYEAGLAQALDWLAGWMRDKHGLIVDVQADASVNPHEKIRVLLFQVVRELLFNVVKHANTYQASVRMSQIGQQVQILVADAGVGFDLKRTHQRQRSASGLGLFSIRERLEWLGGQMTVDSAPDRGTRVQILAPLQLASDERLDLLEEQPLAEVLQQAKASPAKGQAEQQGGRIRVLLADDHAVMRDGLAQLLQTQADIEVVGQAADGQEAVDMTVQLQPDVVLMDVTMPRLGGVDATRRIKEQCAQAHVIGLSMHIEEDMATAMREAGACDYLTKSTDPEDLIATIHSCRQ